MSLSNRELRTLKIADVLWDEPVIVNENEPALKLAGLFKEKNIPLIAVVDAQGLLEGTIMEKEILRRIVTSVEPSKDTVEEKQNSGSWLSAVWTIVSNSRCYYEIGQVHEFRYLFQNSVINNSWKDTWPLRLTKISS